MTETDSGRLYKIKRRRLWVALDALGLWAVRARRASILYWLLGGLSLSVAITVLIVQAIDTVYSRYVIALFLLLDFVLLMALAAFLFVTIVRLMRRRDAGATQRRLISIFVMMALVPTVLVAVFSTLILNFGFADWFSGRVRDAVDSSYETAQAYRTEHNSQLLRDGFAVRDQMTAFFSTSLDLSVGNTVAALEDAARGRSNIAHSFLIDGKGEILARGRSSYGFNYFKPGDGDLGRMIAGETVVIEDWPNNEFRFLALVGGGADRYLYIARRVDGEVLSLLDRTQETAEFYRDTETSRLRLIFIYGLIFTGVSLVVLLVAIIAAIYFANRITRPIALLVRGVERVSGGDLSARVPIHQTDNDEFAVLSHNFNTMTAQIAKSQAALVAAKENSESERVRFNSVLDGVSSGVIGLDGENHVTFINPAAKRILAIAADDEADLNIVMAAPEFLPAIEELRQSEQAFVQANLSITRDGDQDSLLLRVARGGGGAADLILSFDDVSDLVQAQRMAAWGDVARRFAHEIKNPLTPIRLSAERMQRRYGQTIEDEKFAEMTNIIIRQTDDLRAIVDEFSRFSRMPVLKPEPNDWVIAIKSAVALNAERENVVISYSGLQSALGFFDPTLIGQALTNLLKNAIEASQAHNRGQAISQIQVTTERDEKSLLRINIIDDGPGFPDDKARLFEPYVTTKDQGTGLGLPIVKKIVEDHGGTLSLRKRRDGHAGGRVEIEIKLETPSVASSINKEVNHGENSDR